MSVYLVYFLLGVFLTILIICEGCLIYEDKKYLEVEDK